MLMVIIGVFVSGIFKWLQLLMSVVLLVSVVSPLPPIYSLLEGLPLHLNGRIRC